MSTMKKPRLTTRQNDEERLPHHVIAEHILPRLPTKSVLRFKSVRRNWLAAMSTPTFGKQHLELSSHSSKFLTFNTHDGRKIYLLSYDESKTNAYNLIELRCDDLAGHYEHFYVVDSCNGVLCLNLMDSAFALWNPVTKQYKKVPKYCETFKDVDYYPLAEAVGFGYVSSIEDYKILAMLVTKFGFAYFYLFSVNTSTWKRLSDLDGTYYPSILADVVATCIDDTMYWPLENEETSALVGIIGFDLVQDQMKDVLEIPWLHNYNSVDQILMMQGCLSLCCHEKKNHVFDLWMLKPQHGGSKNWSKMYSVDSRDRCVIGFTENGKCLVQAGFFKNDQFVHNQHSGQLKLIDDPIQEDEDDQSTNGFDCCRVVSPARKYVASLVSF